MNLTIDPTPKKEDTDINKEETTNGDPGQQQTDPQLSELDGLKKGGVEPQVHPEDKTQPPLPKQGRP